MNFNCVLNLNIWFLFYLLLSKTSFGEGCDSNELNCINCSSYQKCNDGFSEERIMSCENGNDCDDDLLKQCWMKLNCYALNECTQPGIFPDVMNDSNYFVCLSDASSGFLKYEFTCPEENFFDKSTLTCVPRSATSTTSEDPTSPSAATNPTSLSTLTSPTSTSTPTNPTSPSTLTSPISTLTPTNPTSPSTLTSPISTLTPTNPTSPTTLTSPISSSAPTNPTYPTPPSETTNPTYPTVPTESTSVSTVMPTASTEIPPFVCTGPGIFPNSGNCKMYYRCSTSLKAFFYICPGTSYFNENILKCSLIITPACQEQILKNSTTLPPLIVTTTLTPSTTTTTPPVPTTTTTTTPVPTTTTTTTPVPTTTTTTTPVPTTTTTTTPVPTTTTTTTPVPTTTTTTTPIPTTTTTTTPIPTTTTTTPTVPTTTTIPVPSTPFSCPMMGTFANPLDCKTYYRCSLSGEIFRYVCPGKSYFNEFTKRCSLVITPRCKNLIQS